MQTIDLEKLDYRAIHQQLSRVYELPTEEQKTTRAALQRAYTEKMQEALRQFIGSERFVQMGRPFQRFLYTEGVAFLAKETRSYWLLDMIASYYPKYRGEPFLSAHLKAQDGAGQFSLKVDCPSEDSLHRLPHDRNRAVGGGKRVEGLHHPVAQRILS